MKNKFGKTCKKIDQFGHVVGVNYDGDDTVKTKCGACTSICHFYIVLVFLAVRSIDFYTLDSQIESSMEYQIDLSESNPVNLYDN